MTTHDKGTAGLQGGVAVGDIAVEHIVETVVL